MLAGKRILLGVTGGIAAYKTPEIIRQLKAEGAEVQVVCRPQALEFVTPLTLSVVSGQPVVHSLYNSGSGEWVNHVNLALWAEIIVLAPLTANSLSALVHGNIINFWFSGIFAPLLPHVIDIEAFPVCYFFNQATEGVSGKVIWKSTEGIGE